MAQAAPSGSLPNKRILKCSVLPCRALFVARTAPHNSWQQQTAWHNSSSVGRQSTSRGRAVAVAVAAAAATAAGTVELERISAVDGRVQAHEADVVVIGSGIGGLSCAALLAKYGLDVTVLESHGAIGGAAHAWEKGGYHFESGPSLYSGMADTGVAANPLAHVFQAVGEPLPLIEYNKWNVILPEGEFLTRVGATQFYEVLEQVRGPEAVAEWKALQEFMRPYASAASALPPAALRGDAGVAATAFGRYAPRLLEHGGKLGTLVQPFEKLVEGVVKDQFIKNWLDLLCFLLSGMPASGTIAAEVAFMFNEWYKPESTLQFPVGGSQEMANALARSVRRRGGRVHTAAHVEEITLNDSGVATGVRVRGGIHVTARTAVVTNATLWDAQKLLSGGNGNGAVKNTSEENKNTSISKSQSVSADADVDADVSSSNGNGVKNGKVPESFPRDVAKIPPIRSFMHLHVGFDATGIDPEMHHIIVNSWEGGVDSEQNVVLISIASVADPTMAPEGKHVLHAYTPATEPYDIWEGLDRKSEEYETLKEERSQVLWKAVERVIPDIRARAEISRVGTPLTHKRYLRRHQGSYGPGVKAGSGSVLPGCKTPIPKLYACGDTAFPGIGLPAVAASGMAAANTIVPVWKHWKLLDQLGL